MYVFVCVCVCVFVCRCVCSVCAYACMCVCLTQHTNTICMQVCVSVVTGLGHLDYPGHLSHFLSGLKWVSPGHAYMPDPD